MTREFSIYLDGLRISAALLVLAAHSLGYAYGPIAWWPNSLGHNAVVVFFVLSGYVIAYVVDHKESTFRDFWLSRWARIYSVAVPALLITLLADRVGLSLSPDFYKGGLTTHDYVGVRLAASLLFVNELWLVSIMPFSNSPYWSLCYEMAYYLLFSLWCFGGRRRRLGLLLAMLVIGPKILLLAPVWLAGVVVYQQRSWYQIREPLAWGLWLASLAAVAAFQVIDLGAMLSRWTQSVVGDWLYVRLHFSQHFLGDYILALLIAANFVGFRAIAHRFSDLFAVIAPAVRGAAEYTFSIYLFHLPLVFLATIVFADLPLGLSRWLVVLVATLVPIILIGAFTERRKGDLRRWLGRFAWPLPAVQPALAPPHRTAMGPPHA